MASFRLTVFYIYNFSLKVRSRVYRSVTVINKYVTERPTNHYFDMDTISGNRLVHESMVVTLFGRPRTVQGKIGRAIELDGVSDVVDFGERSTDCFGNLDLCPHGMLVSMWLMPEQLTNNSHYVSTGHNGLSVSYRDKKLHVRGDNLFVFVLFNWWKK